jgi:hypothetical protein
MKRMLALVLPMLALAGCGWDFHSYDECHYHDGSQHCHNYPVDHHDTTTVVYTSANNGGGSNNIIIVEEEPSWCSWDYPYYHDPEYCVYDSDVSCCLWMNIGAEETWCYYDYCGWELVEVYSYY